MIEPSLQLNFAKTRQLDRRISFARADTADNQASYYDQNGILRFARKGEPRFTHDPATGDSLGLLIEEARTNLLTYSEQFDNAAWAKSSATVSANATTAPDATLTADKLVGNDGGSAPYVAYSYSFTAQAYTFSCYLKAAELSSPVITLGPEFGSPIVAFNLITGVPTLTSGAATSYGMTEAKNGWWRCYVTATASGAASRQFSVRQGATGDGTSGIYIWGAQLEAGAFPTSYIPTAASTVTRVAESAVMTGANFSDWYRQDEGTILLALKANQTTRYSGVYLGTSTAGTPHILSNEGTNIIGAMYGTSVSQAKTGFNGLGTAVFGYKSGDSAFTANGAAVATDTDTFTPAANSTMYIGNNSGGVYPFNGTISRLTYFPKRLTDAELQALSSL